MNDRLPSHLAVGALLRGANDAGGLAVVLARGDPQAGSLLLQLSDRGVDHRFLELGRDQNGQPCWKPTGPESPDAETAAVYWQRRRKSDPDLWVIELDIASAERFAAETTGIY